MKLAKIFQDGMLLQRDMPAAIWGSARPGEEIHASIQQREAHARADAQGNWRATLPPLEASHNETLTIRGADGDFTVRDVAVGEVFIAGGQSNIEFHMDWEAHFQEALADCEDPDIRFFEADKITFDGQEPADPNSGVWRKASVQELRYFSAPGYYFARALARELNVPVGIVGCYWGGTRSCAWMTEAHAREVQPEQCAATDLAEWPQNAPGVLYRNMVLRTAPYAARGVLWYQGESDDDFVQSRHRAALDAVMADWRAAWGNPGLPFLVVQLPGFDHQIDAAARNYPAIRACQQQAVDSDAHAWLCSISDAGEEFDIHPRNKKSVGERLALLAEKHIFGRDILADAPRCTGAERDGGNIVLRFDHAGSGLRIEGGAIQALEITADGRPIPYEYVVSGNQLKITLAQSEAPAVRIRFAQTNWYRVNLYNEANIPAIPFELTI